MTENEDAGNQIPEIQTSLILSGATDEEIEFVMKVNRQFAGNIRKQQKIEYCYRRPFLNTLAKMEEGYTTLEFRKFLMRERDQLKKYVEWVKQNIKD